MTKPDAPKGSAVWTFAKSLEQLGVTYAGAINGGAGGKWACPIHDDEHPSLDVTVGRNGKPIFNCKPCHEAMGQEEFVAALRDIGVRWDGSSVEPSEVDWGEASVYTRPSAKHGAKGEVALTAVHEYRFADGSPNFKVKRYDPVEGSEARKHFIPKHKVDGEGFVTGLDGVERTPYHLDRFAEWAADNPSILYIVEGEKAADALVGEGFAATTFHGGTAGKTETDWVGRYGFDLFGEVRLWPDADEAGVDRMVSLGRDLTDVGVEFSFWGVTEASAKDDAADAIEQGVVLFHPLTDADLDRFKALHPKPKRPAKADRPAETRSEPLRADQKALTPATSYEALSDDPVKPAVAEETDDDLPEPYKNSIGKEPYAFATEVIDRHFRTDEGMLTIRMHHDDRQFWVWVRDHFIPLTDEQVGSEVSALLHGATETVMLKSGPEVRPIQVSPPKIEAVVKCMRWLTITADRGSKALLPPEGGIPFANGWLDSESGQLQPLTPDRDIRWVVPADYDEKATCPEWFKFLDSIGFTKGTDARRLLRQWQGWLISAGTDIHKGMLLVGPKRAGKGMVLDICAALLGDGAVGIQLDSFGTNFGMQNLIGKGLATIGDARFGLRTDKSVIERLLSLTGFDTMQIDVKQQKPLSVRLPTRLMAATNETPKFIEASDALSTRFLILEFVNSFYGREDLGSSVG
jgi:hypothetical protein